MQRAGSGALAITYSLRARLGSVRLPEQRPPRRADRLWEHTCFEVFVAQEGHPGYYEFNYAPSGEWSAFAFREYRTGAPLDQAVAPQITVRRVAGGVELHACLDLRQLSFAGLRASLRLGFSAVIEDERGALSYWALKHPPGRPDFHHPEAFALCLDAPSVDDPGIPRER